MRLSRIRRDRGMSLIEVLVALGLAAVLMGGAFALAASQRRTYLAQAAIGKRQQELWVGLEFIQRDLRKAGMGFGFCRGTGIAASYAGHLDVNPNGAASVQMLRAVKVVDGGTSAADTITIRYAEPLADAAPDASLTAAYTTWAVPAGGLAVDNAKTFMTPYGCACASCTFPAVNPFALLYNKGLSTTVCSLVQVTAADCNTNTLTIDPRPTLNAAAYETPVYGVSGTRTYASGDSIQNLGVLRVITYSIDTSDPASPGGKLVRDLNDGNGQQTIAIGVEDLQIVPACDVNANGFVDLEGANAGAKTTDEWFNNVASDTVSATCTTYTQVRVSLIGRTAQAAVGYTGSGRPALENRSAGSADNFHRRVLSTTVALPNLTF